MGEVREERTVSLAHASNAGHSFTFHVVYCVTFGVLVDYAWFHGYLDPGCDLILIGCPTCTCIRRMLLL
jgi:hypothetical protein